MLREDVHTMSMSTADGGLAPRYAVEVHDEGPITIRLEGCITPEQGESLLREVRLLVPPRLHQRSQAIIDLRNFKACAESTQESLRLALQELRKLEQLIGVFVGSMSAGMLQIRRLAREAEIAELFICLEGLEAANEFLLAVASQ
jgi:hypothetical protein